MKIKVDKEEHEFLLKRVDDLEKKINELREHMFENWRWTRESLYKMMEDYFKSQCISVMVKRDKDMIVGEVKKQAIDNLFKKGEK